MGVADNGDIQETVKSRLKSPGIISGSFGATLGYWGLVIVSLTRTLTGAQLFKRPSLLSARCFQVGKVHFY